MMERTARLGLPVLVPGQGQKDMTHNEALLALDALVQLAVVEWQQPEPPADPMAGDCWIVPAGAIGAWAGHDGAVAQWTAGGWRLLLPTEGMWAWVVAGECWIRHVAGAWVQEPAIAPAAGGAVVDSEARATLANILLAMERLGLIDK